ncbi:hypothetical protein TOPB45_0456 [Thermodesulfobacterium geofontis OPF15]|uniref:Phosphate-selective porin O and P n=1 Tax=Thermodesulfobacterium geofontis (strain OPF15) TaxID=795359 RepID=F8C421_THEGP|nr:hypothetical protein [Thermodesulfobacterium geofontis]AEH22560.1 hypothetical protein TOPB45_0456 [Thermodesulfobacterium geofontis OPF15]
MGKTKKRFKKGLALALSLGVLSLFPSYAKALTEEKSLDAKIAELKTLLEDYEKKKEEIKKLLSELEQKEKELKQKEGTLTSMVEKVEKAKDEVEKKNKKLDEIIKALKGLNVNGLWYISYMNGKGKDVGGEAGDDKQRSQVAIKRGYVRFTKNITPWFDAHVTFDVTQVKEELQKPNKTNIDGSIMVRTKYIYGKFKFPDMGFLKKPFLEFGQVHFPWLDYEENLNWYRCQDTMFTERNGLFNSADFGITFMALLGEEMPEWYKKRVNPSYAGRYGSIALGIYNGAGYHDREKNNDKPIEARITLRPLPDLLPGFQISYFGIRGKGNVEKNPPNWRVNLLFASYEHEYFTATAQYYWGHSNQKGSDDYDKDGYSFFLELKPYAFSSLPISLIARYDYFDQNDDQKDLADKIVDESKRYILGIVYHLDKPHKNMLVLDYDYVNYEDKLLKDDKRLQLTLQVAF